MSLEKGSTLFRPQSYLVSLKKKNKVHRKYQNSIRGDPYKPGQSPVPVVPMVPMVQVIRLVRVVRWSGGQVVRWSGGQVVKWSGGHETISTEYSIKLPQEV